MTTANPIAYAVKSSFLSQPKCIKKLIEEGIRIRIRIITII
jgi:hypothetical protein